MVERNWFDKFIGFFSPKSELLRMRAKAQIHMTRSYEAASKGRRTAGWKHRNSSAADESKAALQQLRIVTREAVRNNPYLSRAQEALVSNTIGTGIVGKISYKKNSQKEVAIRKLWKSWAESTECDSSGQNNLYGLQSLCVRSVFESGEVFLRKRMRRMSDGLSVPLQIQVLESDFCDVTYDDTLKNGNTIMQGIEFDRLGRVVAYHFHKSHPGSNHYLSVASDRVRVVASDVIHIFEQTRPGQIRGIPEPHAVMVRINDLDDHEQAQLIKQKVSSAFCAFIYDQQGLAEEPKPDNRDYEMLEPGTIESLGQGKEIKFSNPPSVSEYDAYTTAILRSIASGLKTPTEILMSDYSNINYSSARMSWTEFNRMIERRRWQVYIPKMNNPIFKWFLDAASFVESFDLSIVDVTWTPPRRAMIDPTKEVPATIKSIRSGLTSLSEAQRELGFDSEELLEEIRQDYKKLDEMGLVLDSDPRKLSQVGNVQNGGNKSDE